VPARQKHEKTQIFEFSRIDAVLGNHILAHRLSTHEEVDFELEQIIVLPKEDCDFEKVESESEDEDFSTGEILVSEKSLYSHTGDLLEGNQLGAWERFTSGIGSKLLKKMGWKEGEAIPGGKNSREGRVDPVPIKILAKGKSLDKCMELAKKKKS